MAQKFNNGDKLGVVRQILNANADEINNKVDKAEGKDLMTATERNKLSGIAANATANDTDANLKARGNHTGSQPISTITNLQTELNNRPPTIASSPLKPTGAWYGTQAQYDAIATKDSNVDYNIYG